jgi:phage shock protein PspC (stress-responsive transcriptional regulator)
MSANSNSIQKIKVGVRPLTRLRKDRIIFGVCSGFARKLGISSNLSRLIFSVFTLFTAGILGILLYLIAFFIIPQEPME